MSERILVADDDRLTARFLHSLLSAKGYDVAVADDGLPVIRTNGGVITSRLVHELESLTP